MSPVTFKRVTPHESRIYADGDHAGDVYRQDDILSPGQVFWTVHLHDDPRGPRRVHDRGRIRHLAQSLLDSHPLF
ncbi:MAG: hypothetical protein OXK82_07600 [Deltaproteobacteria bacterium]|nr:hypothetical protein [Deltaproteobacteria bacterium]